MAADEKWYFTKEQLANTPSRKCGYDADKELSCRQQAANFIQDMGQRLQVTQLCINTAIVYMHRFYMFHSFTRFHRNAIAAAALFLAAKVEEQPRKLEHVIKVAQICLHREQPPLDTKSEIYAEHAQDLVMNENVLLQTLGFDVAIDHPHTHVVRCCHLVRASKDLAQTSYFMASNSLHLTTMCLQYKPTVVACFCIHLACKWSNWEIPQSNEGKPWFWYIDRTVTQELLEQLTEEFLAIFEKCPSRLKRKIMSLSSTQNPTMMTGFSMEVERRCNKAGEGTQYTPGPPTNMLPPQGGSSNSTSNSGILSSSEELKKKMELAQRPPPDYKKHSSHHPRMDGHGSVSKPSSCMFGPPQRPHHASASGNLSSGGSRPLPVPQQQQQQQPPVHRTRRPEPPQAQPPRNGTHHDIAPPPPYHSKKYDVNAAARLQQQQSATSSVDKVQCSEVAPSFPPLPLPAQPAEPPLPLFPQPPPKLLPPIIDHPINPPPPPVVPVSSASLRHQPPPPPPQQPPKPKTPPTQVKPERSIFSPEKTTPPTSVETPAVDIKPDLGPVVTPLTPGKSSRNRNSSSSSEPELVPLTPKIEDVCSFESLGKGKTSIKLTGRIPDLIQPIKDQVQDTIIPKEEKPPDLIKPLPEVPNSVSDDHSKEHKKKKKKHKEGKHREKRKEKHKHKHKRGDPEPIVITIPKEKITFSQPPDQSLKIKIAKDKISPSPAGLKIKIPKDKIKESRKRDRSEDRSSSGVPSAKHHRPNGTTLQVGLESTARH